MTENQSPWLSTKHPPKQNVNRRRHQMAKGPLSRKLPPLQMTSGHGDFLLRVTQNSPPPVQLKLARKQSSLMDYFGSSGKNACGSSKAQSQINRSLNSGDGKELNNTVTDDPRPRVSKNDQPEHLANIQCLNSLLKKIPGHQLQPQVPVELLSSSQAQMPKGLDQNMSVPTLRGRYCEESSLDSIHRRISGFSKTSPLREIQVTSVTQSSLCCPGSSEKHLDTQAENHSPYVSQCVSGCVERFLCPKTSKMSAVASESLPLETTYLSSDEASGSQSRLAKPTSNDTLERAPITSQFVSARVNRRVREASGQTVDSNGGYFGEECARAQHLSQNTFSTDANTETETGFNKGRIETLLASDLDVLDQRERTKVQEFSLDSFDIYSESEAKSSLHVDAVTKIRNRTDHRDEGFNVFDLPSNMFASVGIESNIDGGVYVNSRADNIEYDQTEVSRVHDVDSDAHDFDSQVICPSEISSPASSSDSLRATPSIQVDLNLSTGAHSDGTFSLTEDSHSLRFTEKADCDGSEGTSVLSTLNAIYENTADRRRYLKAQHMADMGSLAFTQTQTFPA